MRKYLVVILSLFLVLGFAVLASAQDKPEVKLGGLILIRGWYFDNVTPGTAAVPGDVETEADYSSTVRLSLDAKVADNVQGFMELENSIGEGIGQADATNQYSGLYFWGSNDYNAKPPSVLFFRQLWIQYTGSGLLGVPAGVKVGHQLLSLGEKQFLNHERFGDDAILLFMNPTKESLVGLVTAKLVEGTRNNAQDDIDAYAILGTYKLDKDITVGANLTFINNADCDLSFQNLGLHANTKIADLALTGEIDYQFGSVGSAPEVDFGGYGIFVKGSYKIDPLTIRASVAYGSGDDSANDDKNEEFQTTLGRDNISPYARLVHYTQIYERTTRSAVPALATATATTKAYSQGQVLTLGNTRTTGIANTTYFNIGVDVSPVKDLSLSLDGYYLTATEKWQTGQDDAIGTEFDFRGSYKLAKNLTYFIEAGIFSPGDYYTTGTTKLGTDDSVTQVVHGLSLTF
ncbi:MAG: alginate export family protein [Nitrospirota bacterium]